MRTSEESEIRKTDQEIADGEKRYRDEICGDEFLPIERHPLDLGMSPDIDEIND